MNPFFGGRSSALMLALTLGVCSSLYIMQPVLKEQREYQNSRDLTLENEKKEENMRN